MVEQLEDNVKITTHENVNAVIYRKKILGSNAHVYEKIEVEGEKS